MQKRTPSSKILPQLRQAGDAAGAAAGLADGDLSFCAGTASEPEDWSETIPGAAPSTVLSGAGDFACSPM